MLRPLVDGACGDDGNALTRFADQLRWADARAAGRAAATSSGGGYAQADAAMPAPDTFSMHELVGQLRPAQQPRLAHVDESAAKAWSAEYAQRPLSSGAVATRWQGEFVTAASSRQTASGYDEAWAAAAGRGALAPVGEQRRADALPTAGQLSAEFLAEFDTGRTAEQWTNEYLAGSAARGQNDVTASTTSDYWSDLEQHWGNVAAKQNEQLNDWYQEYDEFNSSYGTNLYKSYVMSEDNAYASEQSTSADEHVAEGERLLAAGDLHQAILRFEAAVGAAPGHGRAWLGLGRAQSENEQEPQAIAALRRALHAMPSDLDTLFSLSVAYTNESMYNDAMETLANWLRSNATYSQIGDQVPSWEGRRPVSSFMDREFFTRLESAFLSAASRQADATDPNLQNALGVLYNMSGDFERAKDSFQTALRAQPNDARIWNRYGATLANSGEPAAQAQAVQAYGRALQLYPAYVRARYNLGIACLHMKAHREALEHMVTAAVLQDGGKGPYLAAGNGAAMSDSIWHTMRVAAMGVTDATVATHRQSLLGMIDQRDLRALSHALSLHTADGQTALH